MQINFPSLILRESRRSVLELVASLYPDRTNHSRKHLQTFFVFSLHICFATITRANTDLGDSSWESLIAPLSSILTSSTLDDPAPLLKAGDDAPIFLYMALADGRKDDLC
eukprot:15334417-Ditylum_brightwellii.AAC.1